jgi:L-aspartate oxidase
VLEPPAAAAPPEPRRLPGVDVTKLRDTVQRAMTQGAGVVRSARSLAGARAVVDDATAALGDGAASAGAGELANLLRLADALLASALARTESRGAHARREYPETDPSWRLRLVHGRVPPEGGDRR